MTLPLRQPGSMKYTYSQVDRDQLKNLLDHVTAQLKARNEKSLSEYQTLSSDFAVHAENPANGTPPDSTKKPPEEDVDKAAVTSDPFASYRSPCNDDDDDSSDDEDEAEDGEEHGFKNMTSNSSQKKPSNLSSSSSLFASAPNAASLSSNEGGTKRKFTPWDPHKYSNYYGSMGERVWTDEDKKRLLAFVNKWMPTDADHKRRKPSSS
ncbi:hypothetical protein ACHAXS_002484 [Conticribra weissflogii]